MFRLFLSNLQHNLQAGVRLALLRPVNPIGFRVSAAQLIALAAIGAFCASLVDLAVLGTAVRWHGAGLGEHVRDNALLLLITWTIAAALRAPALALALPVVILS